jgi:hypothetical protein
MKPKPPPDQHRVQLVRVLAAGLDRARPGTGAWLAERPENFVLVSWTSNLYDERRDIGLDLPGIERLIAAPEPSPADIREIGAWQRSVARCWHLIGDSFPLLTDVLASDALRVTLHDVRRYLDDIGGVADPIRAMLREPLCDAWRAGERVLLVGHSLGSVIAYDTLWELSREARNAPAGNADLLLTLGSPIATRFIRNSLCGADATGERRYPANVRQWVNIAARGEMVALHRRIRPFFEAMIDYGLTESISDTAEIVNHFRGHYGLDVHKSYGYLMHRTVAGVVGDWIADGG